MNRLSCRCSGLVSALLLVFQGAAAQVEESTNPALQVACTAAVQQVSVPASLRAGLASLKFCGVSGPSAVAALWPGFTADDTTLSVLVGTSRFLRDSRIATAVRATALNQSKPQRLRIAALRVLVNYFDSTMVTIAGQLELAQGGTAGNLYGETGFRPTRTTSPLSAAAPVEIGGTLATLASGPNPVVKAAARFIRGSLYHGNPAATPLLSGAVGLTYTCGNRFRVRNTGDIGVNVSYQVVGVAETKTFSVAAPIPPATFKDTFFTTSAHAAVQLLYNGQVLQTKGNEGTTCP